MSNNLPESQPSEEVDLGQLFKLIGNGFRNFFNFIGSILNRLFLAFVWMVFFVKKHFLKIALAGIIGFAYGFIKQKTGDPVYKSEIVIKQNYSTGENLYNTLIYYNELIKNGDSIALSENLKIQPSEANMIVDLELESVLNENNKLKLFDNYSKELDSTLASTFMFETFVENSNEYDYQIQKITLKSLSKKTYTNVFTQIIENIESTEFIKNEQKKDLTELGNRENIIKQSLQASDSLQKVYKNVLEKSVEKVAGGETSITFEGSDDNNITKEYELYNSDLVLRRELVNIQREKEDIENIIEIVSSGQNEGTLDNSQDVFGLNLNKNLFYGLLLALLVFGILLTLEFLKFLEKYKNKI